MQIKTLIVEDEDLCIENLRTVLAVFPEIAVLGGVKTAEAVKEILKKTAVDLLFLDIDLGAENGFDIAAFIMEHYPRTSIIFLTGHADFALDGYSYHPVDYLIKPVDAQRLGKALQRVQSQTEDSSIGLPVDGGFELLRIAELLYIEKKGRKALLVAENGKVYTSSDSLQALLAIFEPYGFFRSHQSFLVPLSRIKGIRVDEYKNTYLIYLDRTKQTVPLSRDHYGELKQRLIANGVKLC